MGSVHDGIGSRQSTSNYATRSRITEVDPVAMTRVRLPIWSSGGALLATKQCTLRGGTTITPETCADHTAPNELLNFKDKIFTDQRDEKREAVSYTAAAATQYVTLEFVRLATSQKYFSWLQYG